MCSITIPVKLLLRIAAHRASPASLIIIYVIGHLPIPWLCV